MLDNLIRGIQREMNNIHKTLEEIADGTGTGSGGETEKQIKVLQVQVRDLESYKADQETRNRRNDLLIKKIQDTLNEIYELVEKGHSESGGTYKRWGRKTCPGTATLLYDGYAAGSAKYVKGAGANILCVPKGPEWNKYDGKNDHWIGRLFGIEYQIKSDSVYSTAFHDKEMPCAVCQTTQRPSVLMIPATLTCPNGWHKEYSGYLMSQASGSDRQPSQFICVDENIEAVTNSKTDNDQGNMYLVESVCGSLPCDKYKNGRELTCVVCSN